LKQLHIGGDTLLTGTDLADAALELAARLAQIEQVELVEIPFLDDDGQPGLARLLLGPFTQIWSRTVTSDRAELTDPVTVLAMRIRADGYGKGTPIGAPPDYYTSHD